jgi:hypothetical protein
MPARFAQSGTVFEIELAHEGLEVIERRLGSRDSVERRAFATPRAASVAYHERVAQLVETRWERRSPCEEVPELAELELVAGVGGGDPSAVAVYNDWLLERDDPRGELASLRAAPRDDAVELRIADLERERGVELFGLLAVLHARYRAQFELGWRHGWIDEVLARHRWFSDGPGIYGVDAREALHHLIHAPMARFVRHLDLDETFTYACARFIGCPHSERIRSLRLCGAHTHDVLDAFPAIEALELPAITDARGHPRVRTLKLQVHGGHEIRLAGAWPALRRLTLVLGDRNHDAYQSVRSWLRNHVPEAITELALSGNRLPGRLIDSLVESPVLEQLDILELDVEPGANELRRLEAALQGHEVELRIGTAASR